MDKAKELFDAMETFQQKKVIRVNQGRLHSNE
jgi:hypothetical protein